MKKFLAVCTVIALLATLLVPAAFAQEETQIYLVEIEGISENLYYDAVEMTGEMYKNT